MEEFNEKRRDDIFSKAVRAGKRTYFFDVKATKRNEYYLTVTESKRRFDEDGKSHFEKHKIFLYKEDFEKFSEGLSEVIKYIAENQPEIEEREERTENNAEQSADFVNVDFDDLQK